jgi:hypothetical protein
MGLSGGRYARQLVRKEGGCAAGGVIDDRGASVVPLAGKSAKSVGREGAGGWFALSFRDVMSARAAPLFGGLATEQLPLPSSGTQC